LKGAIEEHQEKNEIQVEENIWKNNELKEWIE
jgi:hypothetical protein